MKRCVYRNFIDFIDGQAQWLNKMAAQGWRLIGCVLTAYEFESCAPGAYEYAVEFMADRNLAESEDYKNFLESMGYKTIYKSPNAGVSVGKIRWRPWSKAKFATAPGTYYKELLIVEKKNDGKPFELHTELADKISVYKTIRNACRWTAGSSMLLFAPVCPYFVLTLLSHTPGMYIFATFQALVAIFTVVFSFNWLRQSWRISAKIRAWEEEMKTSE